MTPEELTEDFEFIDDWEDRFQYVVEIGRGLEPLPEQHRRDENLVQGCQSRVWLVADVKPDEQGEPHIQFMADSDAQIVKGLVAIIVRLLSGKTPQQILDFNIRQLFDDLQLGSHLVQSRSNGLNSMINRVEALAKIAQA